MDLTELTSGVDPQIHWYYQTKKIPLLRAFATVAQAGGEPWTCLDIGAGSGFFSTTLADAYPSAIAQTVLVDTGYTDQELTGPVIKRRDLPARIEHSYVLLMDVLEHLDDDLAMLQQLHQRSTGRNRYFISVPAFQCVWSYHDVSLGHKRRYTKASLQRVLDQAGFQIDRIYYIYGLIFPIVWAYRKLHRVPVAKSDMRPVHPAVLNWLLKVVNAIELQFVKGNRLLGLTCVAEGTFGGDD